MVIGVVVLLDVADRVCESMMNATLQAKLGVWGPMLITKQFYSDPYF
jgi:hypothetical protein